MARKKDSEGLGASHRRSLLRLFQTHSNVPLKLSRSIIDYRLLWKRLVRGALSVEPDLLYLGLCFISMLRGWMLVCHKDLSEGRCA